MGQADDEEDLVLGIAQRTMFLLTNCFTELLVALAAVHRPLIQRQSTRWNHRSAVSTLGNHRSKCGWGSTPCGTWSSRRGTSRNGDCEMGGLDLRTDGR